MSELEFKKALAREYGIHSEKRKTSDGKILGATAGNIYSEYVINGSEDIQELEKDKIEDIPSDAIIVSDLTNSSLAIEQFKDILKAQEELNRFMSKEEIERLKKLGLISLHTFSIIGDISMIVLSGGTSLKFSSITILDSIDEIDRIIRGCEGEKCKTILNNMVGDKSYYLVKGSATIIGVVQTGRLLQNVVKSLTKVEDVVKVVDKVDDGLKSIDILDKNIPSNIDDILSISRSENVFVPKNSIKGSVVSEKGYRVSYDYTKYGSQIDDIIKNGDITGKKTEKVINEILKNNSNLEVFEGKYGGNKGIDHLVLNKKTGEVWVIDSKQISNLKTYESGSITLLESAAKDTRQLSENWIKAVLTELPSKEKEILEKNINSIRTAVMGINKKTGEVIFVPIIVENK